LRNPETELYEPDYSLVRTPWWPDALDHLHWAVPFLDRTGLVHYPLDGSKIDRARLFLQTYEPDDHFNRRLTIHDIRLADFVAPRRGI
jgi:hypothetical protein